MNITLSQKRFLIIWVLFHSFALLVNLANIEGKISDGAFDNRTTIYLFTHQGHQSDFWPFTIFYERIPGLPQENIEDYYDFNGVFFSYGFGEYTFYMLVGFGIIYLPKLWSDKKSHE